MRFRLDPLSPNGISPIEDDRVVIQTGSGSGSSFSISDIPFITFGDNGILYFRMETPTTGELHDAYMDSTGHWVSTSLATDDVRITSFGDTRVTSGGDTRVIA